MSVYAASTSKTWWRFVFFMDICFPFAMGIGFWQPLLSGWEWFPENKGLVSGFIFAGFGFGPVIFIPISSYLVNPDNLKTRIIEDGTGDTDKLFPKDLAIKTPHML